MSSDADAKRSRRSWAAWARAGSIAMAVLAFVSLGATVVASQRALSDASDVVIRGEGDLLLADVVADLADETAPITPSTLARVLDANASSGLRYVALLDRDGATVVEAGSAAMASTPQKPGETRIEGRRARVIGFLAGRRRPPHSSRADRVGPAILALELEPPVIDTLRRDLARIGIVAAICGGVLFAFAAAWSRAARRLARLEERAALEQRLVALGGMSSVMAHELRNPLASLKGHAQLLAEDLEEAGEAKRHAKATRIVTEAERLELLTASLLDFVRDGPIERRAVAPRELVDRALDDLAKDRVDVDLAAAPKSLDVDVVRLARAIHNLVDNALQAAPDANVALRVASEGGDAVVTVRDKGPGLPADARIFEPFVTTKTRGTGLGLAVARRITEQHDGTLVGENDVAGGAVFTLRLRGQGA